MISNAEMRFQYAFTHETALRLWHYLLTLQICKKKKKNAKKIIHLFLILKKQKVNKLFIEKYLIYIKNIYKICKRLNRTDFIFNFIKN